VVGKIQRLVTNGRNVTDCYTSVQLETSFAKQFTIFGKVEQFQGIMKLLWKK